MTLTRLLKLSALTALAIATTGCFLNKENNTKQQVCSNDWYLLVEKQISTGDSQGHGPDLGSIEWRSTIEFKLGIRDQAGIPDLDTEQWCSYINDHFIKPTTLQNVQVCSGPAALHRIPDGSA
jgi:hypothetical protein